MRFFADSFISALHMMVALDSSLLGIIYVSLRVSILSTIIGAVMAIPLGIFIVLCDFPGKRLVLTVLNTLLSLPTVVVGLFVYTFISRRGIFGAWDLLYTQNAIIIGQVILLVPIVTIFTISAVSRISERYRPTALTLGASHIGAAWVVIKEGKYGIISAIAMAFGRVISEVGISMMLGGNAKGFTRTMTTAMALEYDKGEFVLSIALGIVLLTISFLLNAVITRLQGKLPV